MTNRTGSRWLILRSLVVTMVTTFSVGITTIQARQNVNPQRRVIDSMVASVNGSLITYSDLLWQLTLEPGASLDNPTTNELKRALELVIEQRIIHRDAERMPHIHANEDEVQAAITELVQLFPSQTEFQQRMRRTGLTSEKLKEIISERVDIEKYLDFRFRSFTVVNSKEIEAYYRDTYVPRFRQRFPQQIVPTVEQVRAEIERTIEESKVGSSLQNYLDEARERAEITILNPL